MFDFDEEYANRHSVEKEFVDILDEFFCGRRTNFIPVKHLSKEAYARFSKLRNKP